MYSYDHYTDSEEAGEFETDVCVFSWNTKAKHLKLKELCGKDGRDVEAFLLTMLVTRFLFMLRALRFYGYNSITEIIKVDEMTHIEKVFEEFVARCIKYYSTGEYVTLYDVLEEFRC